MATIDGDNIVLETGAGGNTGIIPTSVGDFECNGIENL